MSRKIIVINSADLLKKRVKFFKSKNTFKVVNLSSYDIFTANEVETGLYLEKLIIYNYQLTIDKKFINEYMESISQGIKLLKSSFYSYCFNFLNRVNTSYHNPDIFIKYVKFESIINEDKSSNFIFIIDNQYIINVIKNKYKKNILFLLDKSLFFCNIRIFIRDFKNIISFCKELYYELKIRNNNHDLNFCNKKIAIVTIYQKKINHIKSIEEYIDYYFKNIKNYFPLENILFIGSYYDFNHQDKIIFNSKFSGHGFLTESNFLSLFIILKCFIKTIYFKFFINFKKERIYFRNIDIFEYVSFFMSRDINNSFMLNLIRYNVFLKFSEKYQKLDILYAFENRPFEKFMLLGLKKYSAGKIYGYLHAPIDLNHNAIYISHLEKLILPLPHKILTIGQILKNDLSKNRNYPEEIIQVIGVLKQNISYSLSNLSKKKWEGNLLVLCTYDQLKNKVLLDFLNFELIKKSYRLRFRLHPAYYDNKIKQLIVEREFELSTHENLIDDFLWSDVIINGGTGAACEALSFGKPIIYVESHYGFNDNMLYDCEGLCWTCKTREELLSLLNSIANLDDDKFLNLLNKSSSYLSKLFEYPNDIEIKKLFSN